MNKQEERSIVEAFLQFGGVAGASMLEWDRERPDAIIQYGVQRVGVEVTNLNEARPRQSIPPQQWWAEACRVVRAAQVMFETRSPVSAVVRFDMRPGWQPPIRRERQVLAAELVAIVEQAISEMPGLKRPTEPATLRDPHPDIAWAYVDVVSRTSSKGHWEAALVNHVFFATAEDIACTVGRKDAEVEIYRKAAPFVWLLVDCDLSGQGSSLRVPTPDFCVSTLFDRVFCCEFGRFHWVEIPTIRPTRSAG